MPGGPLAGGRLLPVRPDRLGGAVTAAKLALSADGAGPLLPAQSAEWVIGHQAKRVYRPREGVLGGVLAGPLLALVHHRRRLVLPSQPKRRRTFRLPRAKAFAPPQRRAIGIGPGRGSRKVPAVVARVATARRVR